MTQHNQPSEMTIGTPISAIQVGMRLRSAGDDQGLRNQVIVTELTERGFKYRIADDEEIINPHWSMRLARDGHEAYTLDGVVYWEPILS